MKWLLLILAFLAGLLITWFMTVKKASRSVATETVERSGGSGLGAAAAATGAGLAGGAAVGASGNDDPVDLDTSADGDGVDASASAAFVDSGVEDPDVEAAGWDDGSAAAAEPVEFEPVETPSAPEAPAVDLPGDLPGDGATVDLDGDADLAAADADVLDAADADATTDVAATDDGSWAAEVPDTTVSDDAEDLTADISEEPEVNIPTMSEAAADTDVAAADADVLDAETDVAAADDGSWAAEVPDTTVTDDAEDLTADIGEEPEVNIPTMSEAAPVADAEQLDLAFDDSAVDTSVDDAVDDADAVVGDVPAVGAAGLAAGAVGFADTGSDGASDTVDDGPTLDATSPVDDDATGAGLAGAAAAGSSDDGDAAPAGSSIKGNRDSMKYHTTESPWYGRTKAEEWFATEDEARGAGYVRWDEKSAAAPAVATFAEASYGSGSWVPGEDGSGPDEASIKGNEDSMLFHPSDSPYYGRTKAEVWFKDEDTARAAGFVRWNEREKAPAVPKFAEASYGSGSWVPGEDGSGPDEASIKGNEDSMLYHSPDSPYYARTKAEVWFKDEEAAKAAGFTRWDRKD